MHKAWLLGILLIPMAAATPTTLSWHMVDGYQDGFLTTQTVPEYLVARNGIPTQPLCLQTGVINSNLSPWVAFTSVSGVWYGQTDQGEPFVQGSYGLARNLTLASKDANLQWFVSSTSLAANLPPVPVSPPVVAMAKLSVLGPEFQAGELLAEGASQSAILAADLTTGASHQMVGEAHVYGFDIPLTWLRTTFDMGTPNAYGSGSGLILEVQLAYDLPCPQQAKAMGLVAYSGPGLRPALTLDVEEPVELAILGVTQRPEGAVVWVQPQSVWGKNDIGDLTVTATHESGAAWSLTNLFSANPRHSHTPEDLRFGAGPWVYPFLLEGSDLPPGAYVLYAKATDLSGTSSAEATSSFDVEPAVESPWPSTLFLLGLLMVLVGLRRRS